MPADPLIHTTSRSPDVAGTRVPYATTMAKFTPSSPSSHNNKRFSQPASVLAESPDGSDPARNWPTASPSFSTAPSSPASCDGYHRTFSLSSIRSLSWRSHNDKELQGGFERARSFRARVRRLSRSRQASLSSFSDDFSFHRGGSEAPEGHGGLSPTTCSTPDTASVANTAPSAFSPSSIYWTAQKVEGHAPLEPDPGLLKAKAPHLVVTLSYLIKMKSLADAQALFPELASDAGKRSSRGPAPSPQLVIPVDAIVSAFPAESTRPPSCGIEVWWRNPQSSSHASLCRCDILSFSTWEQRNEQLRHIAHAIRASHHDENSPLRPWQDLRPLLERVHDATEHPRSHHRRPDIFPVVPRGATRRECMPRLDEAGKKHQEVPAFFLVVGTFFCHLVEVHRVAKAGGEPPVCRHRTYGLVTLEELKGEWMLQDERFSMTFREPFEHPVTLELASHRYRQIIRAVGMADRYLKPAWPQVWQAREIFHVAGLQDAQYLVAKEDYGSFQRTLDAYLAAYHCDKVNWEINWRTPYAPEFRLLPGKRGPYTPRQLLAVLRALRYNDYFTSLSFRGVDLSVLRGLQDPSSGNPPYLSRSCYALKRDEIRILKQSPLLHQEFHALAFCSETVRQIDLSNCSGSLSSRLTMDKASVSDLEFLAPILNLLRIGITKCSRLIVSGNILPLGDIQDLALTMKCGVIRALDISRCGLDDFNLHDIIVDSLPEQRGQLRALTISGNPGRLPARVLPDLLGYLADVRELNLSGSIQGDSMMERSVLPIDTLQCMSNLEELDLSGYKLDGASFHDLECFLQCRSWQLKHGQPTRFHKLVLNNCGVTGTLAARLFDAIDVNCGLTVSLSGNPLEQGIDSLAAAIRSHKGPAALYLDMVEFRHESNYLTLLQSLASTTQLRLLSLVGTAPAPSPSGRCSAELVSTLRSFLAENTSIRHLDLSGFSSKLDDVQLPRGWGRALAGLAENATLTHLRVRNQNLHGDVGMLGRALAQNGTLVAVDCRDNNLNLTSLRFLVDSLAEAGGRSSIVQFPLACRKEREAILANVLRSLKRASPGAVSPPPPSRSSGSVRRRYSTGPVARRATYHHRSFSTPAIPALASPAGDVAREEEVVLRRTLDDKLAQLEAILRANRERTANDAPCNDEGEDVGREEEHGSSCWPSAAELLAIGRGEALVREAGHRRPSHYHQYYRYQHQRHHSIEEEDEMVGEMVKDFQRVEVEVGA
ncbi:hypothetical protein VTJ83DRAFT_2584 [Remersonia thermophila]|uniref:LRR-containing protein second PH domain-containing protein n=1 Tax=Remersonia thermophila TaxID=72144 RepID=A0ABR4DJ79_9PEZI